MNPLSKPHAVDRLLKEDVWYPPHEPRKETPEYKGVHHKLVVELDLPCLTCGVRNSTLNDPSENKAGAKQLETHHHIIEWALANAVSLEKFNKIIWPHLQHRHGKDKYPLPFTQQQLLDFVDHSEDNLWVLCVTPDTKVLMADWTEKPIHRVKCGDKVIGHDGRPHTVTAKTRNLYKGNLFNINGVKMTPEHPTLTDRGWVNASDLTVGDVVYQFRMIFTKMLGMRANKFKILNPIIGSIAVKMMNTLGRLESSTQKLLHYISMFKHWFKFIACPYLTSDVSFSSQMGAEEPLSSYSKLEFIKSIKTATFGAVNLGASTLYRPGRMFPTGSTIKPKWLMGMMGVHDTILPYEGYVYNLECENSHSFIANGLVVHNCDVHHRHSLYGIHAITAPIWGAQDLMMDDFTLIGKIAVGPS